MIRAVVWYQSRAVLAAIATIIMAALSAFHVLPGLTNDQVVDFLLVAVPAAVALEGRISATKTIAATPARAAAASSTNPSDPAPIDPPPAAPASSETETDMKLIAPIAAAALLAGCSTTGTNGAIDSAVLTTTKALTVAENAYQLAAAAAIDAAATGKVPPAVAAQIKTANDKAVALLDAAHAAQSTAEQAADAEGALAAIGELSALLPAKGS